MHLLLESDNLEDYLKEIPPIVQFTTPEIQAKIIEIKEENHTNYDRAKAAFIIARDQIKHSFDTDNPIITINAEDTIHQQNGICFAKSHLLATLLRGMNIPAGFCYQRVLRKVTLESGYALHGLNALYLDEYGWFRVDPRGNKAGIDSQFTTNKETLAYPIREELGEIDYPNVFVAPLNSVIKSMKESKDCKELYYNRPDKIEQY